MTRELPQEVRLLIGAMNRLTPSAREDAIARIEMVWGMLDDDYMPRAVVAERSKDVTGSLVLLSAVITRRMVLVDLVLRDRYRNLCPSWKVTIAADGSAVVNERPQAESDEIENRLEDALDTRDTVAAVEEMRALMRTFPAFRMN